MDLFKVNEINGLVIDRFFSPQRCQDIIDMAEESDKFIFLHRGETKRTHYRYTFIDANIADEISDRLQTLPLEDYLGSEWLIGNEFIISRYSIGHSFGTHVDLSKKIGSTKTTHTLMIYLNADFEGGRTIFLKDEYSDIITYAYKPDQPGSLMIFPQDDFNLPHYGEIITDGCKYILRANLVVPDMNVDEIE